MGLHLRKLAAHDVLADRHEFMRIDGDVWQIAYVHHLFLRMPSLPEGAAAFLVPTHPTIARVVRNARAEKPRAQTPAQRMESGAQIGTIPVLAEALDAIEGVYPSVRLLWSVWRGYFVARTPAREVVAVWKLPEGASAVAVFVVAVAGELWATNHHFATLLPDTKRVRAELGRDVTREPRAEAMIAAVTQRAPGQVVVPRTPYEDGGAVQVGPVFVPRDQFEMVDLRHAGAFWHYTGPTDPVVARFDGKVVGFVMPLLVESPGSTA